MYYYVNNTNWVKGSRTITNLGRNSDGNMIFNIAIRTLTLNDKTITYPVGGGIVWDSNHEDERLEAIQKSKILS